MAKRNLTSICLAVWYKALNKCATLFKTKKTQSRSSATDLSIKMDFIIYLGILIVAKFSSSEAGICWRRRHADKSCSGMLRIVSNQKDCCSKGGVAFSNGASSARIFFYMFVKRPPCSLCKDACSNIKCHKGWKCMVTSTGVPACRCQPDCSKFKNSPVCGSDGRTYSSECRLLRESCKNRRLAVEYQGACKKYCTDVQCRQKEVCVADKNGNSYCIDARCPSTCPRSLNQVCGTDRKTYQNECSMKKASCESGRRISLAYLGACQTARTCNNVKCPNGKQCVLDITTQPRCVNCACAVSQNGVPVCGSDGKKYTTWCHMRKSSCQKGHLIRVDASKTCK